MTAAHPPVDGTGLAATVRALQLGEHLLFAVLVAVTTGRALLDGASPGWVVIGVAALVGWYAVGFVLARRAARGGEDRAASARRAGAWWLVGLTVLWLGVVAVSPEFVWLAFVLWLLAGHLLPLGPALAFSVVVLVVTAGWPAWGGHGTTWAAVIGPAVGMLVALGVSRGQLQLVRDARERERLLTSLVTAQAETSALQDQLSEAQHAAGVLEERGRLSREIHDTLAQGFSSIVLLARAAADQDTAPGRRAELVDLVGRTAEHNLAEARRIVAALAPEGLAEHGLAAAVGRLLAALQAETGARTDLRVDGDLPHLPTSAEVALLRVAQGALANVRAHAGARRVVVTLSVVEGAVRMDVLDDGSGFDAGAWERDGRPSAAGGYGLRVMRSRLREVGGDLQVESAPCEGTVLSASLPVAAPGRGGVA